MTKLKSSGYVVIDKSHSAIWGTGATADAAWADFISERKMAGVEVVDDINDAKISCEFPEQERMSNYEIFAATTALLNAVDKNGGNIAWTRLGVVLALPDEVE